MQTYLTVPGPRIRIRQKPIASWHLQPPRNEPSWRIVAIYQTPPQHPRPQRLWTAALLRACRRRTGRTQDAMARAIGVSDSTWSRFEQGNMPIPVDLLHRLEQMLDIREGSLATQADQLATHYRGAIGTSTWRRQVAERLHPPMA